MEKSQKKTKKKNVQPATEKKASTSATENKPVEDENIQGTIIVKGKTEQEPTPEQAQQPATIDERVANLEAGIVQIAQYLKGLDQTFRAQQTARQNQAAANPNVVEKGISLAERLLGGSSNPLGEKMDKLVGTILDKAIENSLNPPKPLVEVYLEKEIAKKMAKSMAEAT